MNIISKTNEARRREKREAKRKVRESRRKLKADATQAEVTRIAAAIFDARCKSLGWSRR